MSRNAALVVILLAAALAVAAWLCWSGDPAQFVGTDAETPQAGRQIAAESSAAAHEQGSATRTGGEDATRSAVHATAVTTGDLLVHVRWSDGATASGIALCVSRRDELWSVVATGTTSEDGDHLFSGLPAGTAISVRADRGAETAKVTLHGGERTEVTLQLAPGKAVTGVVEDATGARIGGADVWLTIAGPAAFGGRIVARSATDGTFALRGIDPTQSLGALAPGRAPSALVDLDRLDTTADPVRVVLVVGEAGGALVGRVLAPDGAGMPGAKVAVGRSDGNRDMRNDGSWIEQWSPRIVTTEHDGSFRCDSLAPGEHPVEVLAARFPVVRTSCRCTAGTTTELLVQLQAPVTLTGTVRDAAGTPVPAATVRAFQVAVPEDFLQFGQYDFACTFRPPVAVAAADGTYRLEGCAPGAIHGYANPPRGRGRETMPWAHAELAGEAGAVVRWDPVIDPGHVIRGVVRHRDGVPMQGLFVTAYEMGTGKHQAVTTDRQGRFTFHNLQAKPYDLSVQFWQKPADAPELGRRSVWPDQGEVELVAAFDAPKREPPGSVTGRVFDAGKRLTVAGRFGTALQLDNRSWNSHPKIEGDRFTFDEVEVGRRRVLVMDGETPVLATDWFEVHPAQQVDLGILTTTPGGSLRLSIERGEGTADAAPTVFLGFGDWIHGAKATPGTAAECTVDNLEPGVWRIRAYGKGMRASQGEVLIEAGKVSTAVLRLTAAVAREIVVDYPEGEALAAVAVRDAASGESIFDWSPQQTVPRPYSIRLTLPLGRFVLRATAGGDPAQVEFAMTTLAPDQPPVRLTVR